MLSYGYGDSITYRPDSWCDQIPGCIPRAVPGEQTWDGVARLLADLDAGTIEPTAPVVLAWGVNDVRGPWTLNDTITPLGDALSALHDNGNPVTLWVPTPQYDAASGAWHPVANPRVELEIRPALYDLADTHGAAIADQWDAILSTPDPASLFADHIHPNADGSAILAATVVPEPGYGASLAMALAAMVVVLAWPWRS